MAADATPLFVPDKVTLKLSLRLGKIVSEDAAEPLLNDAMLKARVLLLRILTSKVVNKILLTPSTTAPMTITEVRRVEAEQLEVLLTKRYMIDDLTTVFLDDSGDMLDSYSKEAPFRLTTPEDRRRAVHELELRSNDLAGRLVADLVTAPENTEHGATLGINGVGSVLLGPPQEAPVLSPREGHVTTTCFGNASRYTRERLWHR